MKYGQEEFIAKCKGHHGELYDYSKTIFTKTRNKVIVICKIHGDFIIEANSHACGHGCWECRNINNGIARKFTKEQIVKRATDIWGDRFDYSELEYTGILNKHRIKCNLCGQYFIQDLNNHINFRKNGCPNCQNERGWSRSQWINFCKNKGTTDPLVYIVRLFNDNESFAKIGITSRTIHERISAIPYEYEVIKEIKGSPRFVYDKENELHRKYVKNRYIPKLEFKGEGECFDESILADFK